MPLLSAKNRKRRLQFAQTHQNWTIEDWKNVAWSDESRFLLRHSDVRVRIWHKEHESLDPSCLVSTVQAAGGGIMVWGIFSSRNFWPLTTKWSSFKCHSLPEYCCWPCPSLYDYSVPIFWWLFPAGCIMYKSSNHLRLVYWMSSLLLKWPPQSPDLNPIEHLWDVVEREIRIMDVQPTNLQQLRDAIMSIWTKISEECFQHLVESMSRIIKAVLKEKKVGPTR